MSTDTRMEKLRREAAQGDLDAQERLNRHEDRAMRGPYSHLIGEHVVFVDDYSHYRGKVNQMFALPDGYLFHVEPCYQVSQFQDDGPRNATRIDNGPLVLDSRRFKVIVKQPDKWPQ